MAVCEEFARSRSRRSRIRSILLVQRPSGFDAKSRASGGAWRDAARHGSSWKGASSRQGGRAEARARSKNASRAPESASDGLMLDGKTSAALVRPCRHAERFAVEQLSGRTTTAFANSPCPRPREPCRAHVRMPVSTTSAIRHELRCGREVARKWGGLAAANTGHGRARRSAARTRGPACARPPCRAEAPVQRALRDAGDLAIKTARPMN